MSGDGERALLGRQASWPPGRYSTIAGFVEPGESFEDAVARASESASPGDTVLLSPACASFDMFRNYNHRGEVFAAAVRKRASHGQH